MNEEPRCERCGWPLVKRQEDGCVPGNCSQRPLPPIQQETPTHGSRFDLWWDSNVHGWGKERLSEYKLAKESWETAQTIAYRYAERLCRDMQLRISRKDTKCQCEACSSLFFLVDAFERLGYGEKFTLSLHGDAEHVGSSKHVYQDGRSQIVEPSNAEQSEWSDATRQYVAGILFQLSQVEKERDEWKEAADHSPQNCLRHQTQMDAKEWREHPAPTHHPQEEGR